MKKTLRDIDLEGRRLLMRVDFNVPLTKDGDISDDTRIKAALPSIEYAAGRGAAVVLMSHLGRPGGRKEESLSLKVAAYGLAAMTAYPVKFVDDCIGEKVAAKLKELRSGEVLLLENLRFYPGEEGNDPGFAKELAGHGDIYANDAFGTAHRQHASTAGVTGYFSDKVAGFLMEKELEVLGGLLGEPERPFVALLGGAKVSGKIGLVRNLLDRVDRILVGGGMAFSFFKAVGLEVGMSLVDDDLVPVCREVLERAGLDDRKRIFLPVDCVVAKEIDADAGFKTVSTGDIPADWIGVDIGEKTVNVFARELSSAKTVFWNGPMGVFEIPSFAAGTKRVAKLVSEVGQRGGKTVVGGGDSVAALNQLRLADKITHISTGGGASLKFLEGKILPGVEALDDRMNG